MIQIITHKLSHEGLAVFCAAHFKTFVKFVVDIRKNVLAIGGELHADAEQMLLEHGSVQSDLWGGNFFPWKSGDERFEYTSFINIRPRDNNMGMEVMDETIRKVMRDLCGRLLLANEESISMKEPE